MNGDWPPRRSAHAASELASEVASEVPGDLVDKRTSVHGRTRAFRVMRYLGMLPGPKEMVEHPRWIEPSQVLTSPKQERGMPPSCQISMSRRAIYSGG